MTEIFSHNLKCGGSGCHKSLRRDTIEAMLGLFVNVGSIVIFSLLGAFFIKGIPARFEDLIKKAIGLFVIFIGIRGALANENILLLIISMVAGAVIGELLDIDKWMNRAGDWAEKKLRLKEGETAKRSFSKGFVSASVLFCSGSMAILGSMQSGLSGNHDILFAKSVLDGVMALVFSASFGIGVAFSALTVLIYQGGIVLASTAIREHLAPEMIREMAAAGSLVLSSIGFNFLGTKEIKVANLIPAMFIPCVYLPIAALVTGA